MQSEEQNAVCEGSAELPVFREGKVIILEGKYYLLYDYKGCRKKKRIGNVNPLNTEYLSIIASAEINNIKAEQKQKKAIKEFKKWGKDILENHTF